MPRYPSQAERTPEQEAHYQADLAQRRAKHKVINAERNELRVLARSRMTPAREALLRQIAAQPVTYKDAVHALNALPGKPFIHYRQVSSWAHTLKITRPSEVISALLSLGAAERHSAYKKNPQNLERRALMAKLYPDNTLTQAHILEQLNAIKGSHIKKWRSVQNLAALLGLSRPRPCAAKVEPKPKLIRPAAIPKPNKLPPKPKLGIARPEPKTLVAQQPSGSTFAEPQYVNRPKLLQADYINGDQDAAAEKLLAKHAKAKQDLRNDQSPSTVASQNKMSLHEVFRLVGEIRRESKEEAA